MTNSPNTTPGTPDPTARGTSVERLREAIDDAERAVVNYVYAKEIGYPAEAGYERTSTKEARTAALAAVEREMAHMDAQGRAMADDLMSWENREAACCPEDVGFEEHIAALEAERDELRKERDARPTLEEAERSVCAVFLPGDYVIGQRGHARDSVLDAVRALYAEKAKATEAQHG